MSPRAARRAPGKGVVEEEGGHREDRQDRVERVVEIRRPLHEVLEGNLQARESYGEACVSVLQGGGELARQRVPQRKRCRRGLGWIHVPPEARIRLGGAAGLRATYAPGSTRTP